MFCRHKWKILSETTTESAAEHMMRVGGFTPPPLTTCAVSQLIARELIQVVSCEKCGKLKRFVTTI